jgi:hypothetical protein
MIILRARVPELSCSSPHIMRLYIAYPSEGVTEVRDEYRTSNYKALIKPNANHIVTVTKTGQAEEEQLAKFEFRTFRPDRLVLRGKEREAGAWLQKKRFSSYVRTRGLGFGTIWELTARKDADVRGD